MSEITKDIISICHHLIEKHTNTKTENSDEYNKALDEAQTNPEASQEILANGNFYVNIKNNIGVKLYKEISIVPSFNDMEDHIVYRSLHEKDQIIKTGSGWYRVAMQPGDIEIKFNDSAISKKISENERVQKNGAIIKGEECFIEKVTPGGRDGDHYHLVESTQEDLKAILTGLTELL